MSIQDFFAHGTTTRFQPDVGLREMDQIDESAVTQRLAKLVALVAFGLPIIMLVGVLAGSCFRYSLSHFYYAQFLGPIFVGLLVFIGGFLIAYQGETPAEDYASTIAGVGACFVGMFPTTNNGCLCEDSFVSRVFSDVKVVLVDGERVAHVDDNTSNELFQLFTDVGDIHSLAAAAVFLFLGWYCWAVLGRVVPGRHHRAGAMIETKRRRNHIYRICAVVIFACVFSLALVWNVASPGFDAWWNSWNLTFFVETIALWAFALAWSIKGRFFKAFNDPAMNA